MTEQTALDPALRYLVPVARLDLPGEPDEVHLSLYEWLPQFEAWATGLALCGRSATQGPLPGKTGATCRSCLTYGPQYQAVLDEQARAAADRAAQRSQAANAAATPENGAWFTVWLEGNWSWVTKKMTTEQREYAADRVAAYSRYLAECDNDLEREEPDGLRWWREAGR